MKIQKVLFKKTKEMRRSKSTEAWWPRKLFEHYDGVLDLAGKVMRTADSSLTASDIQLPSVNNASLKVFPVRLSSSLQCR